MRNKPLNLDPILTRPLDMVIIRAYIAEAAILVTVYDPMAELRASEIF